MATWGSIRNNTLFSLASLSQRITDLQEMASTGKRVVTASDAPGDAFRILHLRAEQWSLDAYSQNLQDVVSNLEEASGIMEEVSTGLARAQQLLAQGANATLSPTNRVALGHEIDSLLEQTVSMANSTMMGRYLFGGAILDEPPYVVERVGGKIVSVTYQGSHDEIRVPVAPGVDYSGTIVGDSVFRNNQRQAPLFLGETGAAGGSFTSNVTGDVWLEIRHVATTYNDGGASGLAPAATSGDQDTVLGIGAHSLTVTAAGTIQLDGGPEVTIDGSTDLMVTSGDGDTVVVDTSGWGGWTGTFSLDGSGEMSIDGFATSQAVTFAGEQRVVNSATGKALYVDSTAVVRSGHEPVRVPGTYDLFQTLIHIRDLLLNTRGLSGEEQADLLGKAVPGLEEASVRFTQGMTSIGGKLQAMDSLQRSMEDLSDQSKAQASQLEDADIIQVATDLAHVQSYYQLTLSSTSKLLSMTLLDFL